MKIRGLIFDMDGLMIDTERWLHRYWCQAAREYGFPLQMEDVLQIRSLSAELASAKLKLILGDTFDYDTVKARRKQLMAEHVEKCGVEEKKGLGVLLDYAKAHGYKLAVATATDLERTTQYLTSIGKIAYFDTLVCGGMVTHGKPAPDIYLEAARQLGLPPEECVALEDSPNGILSAFRAGCKPIMVPDLDEPDQETRKRLFGLATDLEQVIDLLKQKGE